ncbi:MAG: dihydropteroate synthase, partial [Gallionella sp.]|nr:dihydropteroate synthase [Gallionella sp.]
MLLHCGKFQLDLSRPLVMGIVNVTPDSFSDGGQHLQLEAAIA